MARLRYSELVAKEKKIVTKGCNGVYQKQEDKSKLEKYVSLLNLSRIISIQGKDSASILIVSFNFL